MTRHTHPRPGMAALDTLIIIALFAALAAAAIGLVGEHFQPALRAIVNAQFGPIEAGATHTP